MTSALLTSVVKISPPSPISFRERARKRSPSTIRCVSDSGGDGIQGESLAAAVNRRNICLGGGLMYAAGFGDNSIMQAAVAAPLQPPDITDLDSCKLAVDKKLSVNVDCCLPYGPSPKLIDFEVPNPQKDQVLRVRKPIQNLSPAEVRRYRKAIKAMKDYDPTHPWNFMQQAQIHCAFCNGAYPQKGFPQVPVQVHGGWFFLPWHRYYLYFWERILGKLIGDDTFAIPYWNWDTEEGMQIDPIYREKLMDDSSYWTDASTKRPCVENPIYNAKRNQDHLTALLDLDYKIGKPNPKPEEYREVINNNLFKIRRVMKDYKRLPADFMGYPLSEGQVRTHQGHMEELHNVLHLWTGEPEAPNFDMGNFHTSGREPLFFAHHANVDRLWSNYRKSRRYADEFPDNTDWHDSTFVFYDDNNKVVKCKVSDSLCETKLGYRYEEDDRLMQPQTFTTKPVTTVPRKGRGSAGPVGRFGEEHQGLLKDTIKVLVGRPKTARSEAEKETEIEMLCLDGFTFNPQLQTAFDVYMGKPAGDSDSSSENVGVKIGSFSHIPHSHVNIPQLKSNLHLNVQSSLGDIDADASKDLVVSIVPKSGEVSLFGVGIQLVPGQRIP